MNINEIQDEIIEEFEAFDDWMDKYQLIIEMADTLPPLPDGYRIPENLIAGCQSRVWLQASYEADKRLLTFQGDSDAMIVKGLVALVIRVLSGQTPEDILHADLYFIERIGLKENLSPTRSNGFLSMIKQMKTYALAYSTR